MKKSGQVGTSFHASEAKKLKFSIKLRNQRSQKRGCMYVSKFCRCSYVLLFPQSNVLPPSVSTRSGES